MALAERDEDEVIESPEVEEEESEQVEQTQEGEESSEEQPEQEPEPEAESEEVVVTIEGESPPQEEVEAERAPVWVKELRKRNQETVRENRELKKQLEALKTSTTEKTVELGEKPKLADFDYDEDAYGAALDKWHADKAEHAELERRKQEDGIKAQREWQAKLDSYGEQARKLKVSDYSEAETSAKEVLNVTQQGIIVSGAENPALVVYALGKNPKKAQELASITDPVKFAFAVAKLEGKISMDTKARKSAPLPESSVRSNARVTAGVDPTLQRLEEEADRTGDRTKVAKYKREQRDKRRA